jgi:hypothetical protein
MALISPQAMAVTGTAPTFSTPTASDTLAPTDRGVYIVRTTGTATTVALVVPGNDDFGQARPDVSVSVGATAVHVIPLSAYARLAADPTTGLITITHSGALTGVTSCYITI